MSMATRSVAQALHTFGGYGLTTEYDIFLYNLRAKAWPLVFGDPQRFLEEAGRRFYAGETAALPEAGDVPIDFDLGDDARAITREIDEFFAKNVTPEMRKKFHYFVEGFVPELNKKLADAAALPRSAQGCRRTRSFAPMPRSPRWMPSSTRAITTRSQCRRWSR
jgi:alkylation response protein AidB-like acyl-CoA dehydrogenase